MNKYLPGAMPDDHDGHVPLLRASNSAANGAAMVAYEGARPMAPARLGEEEQFQGGDFQHILAMLMRRWPIMLLTLVAVMIAGVVYALISPPIFQAATTIELSDTKGTNDANDLSDIMGFGQQRSLETQVKLLQAGPIQAKAIEALPLASREAIREYSEVSVDPVASTNLIAISAKSHKPQAAIDLSNAIGREYIQLSLEKNRSNLQGAIKYVEDQLETVETRLNSAQTELKQFKQKNNLFSLEQESQTLTDRLGSIQADLQSSQGDRAAAVAELAALQQMAARQPQAEIVPETRRRPEVDALRTRLTELNLDLVEAQQEYAPTSRRVQRIQGQIADVRRQLETQSTTEVVGQERVKNPLRAQLDQDIAKAQAGIWAADARSQAMQGVVSNIQSRLSRLPEQEYKFSQLAADVQTLQERYKQLNDRYQSLLLNQQARVADARIVFPATAGNPVGAAKSRIMLYTLALGLMLAFSIGMLIDVLDNRIHSDEDAEQVTQLPVLAHVPFAKESEGQSLLHNPEKASALLESNRMLRANIAFSGADHPIRSIMITSSVPHEGKSSTAVNLAVATAMSGERVILIDCDLRRPTLHRRFKLSNRIGFSSVVTGAKSLEDALQETSIPGLYVLTSGPVPPNPVKLLNSKGTRLCLQQIMDRADFVIVDTPPALGLTDARIISTMADASLLVISCREAGRREITRTTEMLRKTGTELIGTVLNKLTTGFGGSYQGYYYYQYYMSYLSPQNGDEVAADKGLESAEETALATRNS